ncbi:MAG TPA: type I CRISPR-associated protein Cas7 [Bacteroidales bacterium]|jgi:CRISPR-associated protein Csh2|nr:type I CRISPR-associated protein Cas7 [Bacteroidales bacterium]HOJ25009.1 type I CRISPR-associated protein Cas7 [Bacteroidales bacterium]HPL05574.1 type I CRISPR-associated protein Cas7 [Bacteroidales bacterium]
MNYSNRIYGAALIKAINSNYNADFSGQPRTLPNGIVYATDKALKYAIKNFIKENFPSEKVFYFKRFNEEFIPYSLDDAFAAAFPMHKDEKDKKIIAKDLLSCIDIRLFGATFAKKSKDNVAISIHGPVQITHGVNVWHENNFYSEQIMSPFRNPNEKNEDNTATTLGRQSRLHEGHYLHHFSVNPKNLEEILELAGNDANTLKDDDISKLKEALQKGVTYYDSAAKVGCENELLVWVTLKPESKLVMPNFTQLMKMSKEKVDGKVQLDMSELKKVVDVNKNEIEAFEIYLNNASIIIANAPDEAIIKNL